MVAQLLEATIHLMTINDLNACWALDHRCFEDGEAYDRETFRYLLSNPGSVSYKIVSARGVMIAFLVGLIERDGTGHIIAVGVAPEYRRLGYGRWLMEKVEDGFRAKAVRTTRLEVRTSNIGAQRLYIKLGYIIVERMPHYYSNGDDGFLMVKSIADMSPPTDLLDPTSPEKSEKARD
ncbi:MAG: N-acetyltransferase [Acidobacteriota bacterium]